MTKKQTKGYWQLKNQIGYALLAGNKPLQQRLETELRLYLSNIKLKKERGLK
ncbi:MAG: hypothetical protein GY928_34445 [Colwellia sp.]|nr:hypothetical protein [Colwellia sp.]